MPCYLLGKLSIEEKVEERDSGRREEVNGWIKGSLTDGSRSFVGLPLCWRKCLDHMFCLRQGDPGPWTVQGGAFTKQGSILFIFHGGQSCSHPSYHICLAWNLYLETLGENFLATFISLFTQTQKDMKYIDLISPIPPLHTHSISGSPSVDSDAAKIYSG